MTTPIVNIISQKENLPTKTVLACENVSIWYGTNQAVKNVDIQISQNNVTAIIGPSGCGKSTLLRTFNRMNDFVPGLKIEGRVSCHGMDLYDKKMDPVLVRQRIGMVFQKPNPFPKTIYDNIVWGPRINGFQGNFDELVQDVLVKAALWDEVKDRLNVSALNLSGGQQQRLCIARALALQPEVILMDEPCSALDPISTASIEDLIFKLKEKYTIVIVTHNMQQAARVSDFTAFFNLGYLVEFGPTDQVFTSPKEKKTAEYVTGRFG
jgi:phosphate transport system ATP-binding protein